VESEAGVLVEVQAVVGALEKLGMVHRVAGVARLVDLPPLLAASPEPIVFNLVEGFQRRPEEASYVPALCLAFGKMSTGNSTPCLALALDKWQTKGVLQRTGLPVPGGILVQPGRKVSPRELPPPPWIVKPAYCDGSEGIDAQSCIFTEACPAFLQTVRAIHEQFGQPVLVEQFVGRRELNVTLLERNGRLDVLPIAEVDFSAFGAERPRIVDYAAKWLVASFEYRNTPTLTPAPLDGQTEREAREYSCAAWQALGCTDYARVDFRLDDDGRLVILEVNPNPDVSPEAGFAGALTAAGIPYEDFVRVLVENAGRRLHSAGFRRGRKKTSRGPRLFKIRSTEPADRDEILRMVSATGFFSPGELDVAREVLDEAIATGPRGQYQSFTAEVKGRAAGWVCFGPTPCTSGTFDIYWVVVSPECQERGIGKGLMRHAEKLIAERGGRLAVVETSGRPAYEPTQRFYRTLGYEEKARVADFYAPGDAKVIYVKRLG
jgi:D-alanine-D-alanine ligase